jgi:2-polyprenyl-6-methoxyphenol hydroxylase-like FAD-dependent oxidoreductase
MSLSPAGSTAVTLLAKHGWNVAIFEKEKFPRFDCSGRNGLIGARFKLRRSYLQSRKFALFAHFENVDREAGIDGTSIKMVRGKDRWIWMIPITCEKDEHRGRARRGDLQTHARRDAYNQILQQNPMVHDQMPKARRVTDVLTF